MRVSDFAKEIDVTSDDVLSKLKSLRLKAKNSKQELSDMVLAVLRREFKQSGKVAKKAEEEKPKSVIKEKKEKKPSLKEKEGEKVAAKKKEEKGKTVKRKTETKRSPRIEEVSVSKKKAAVKKKKTTKTVTKKTTSVKKIDKKIKERIVSKTSVSERRTKAKPSRIIPTATERLSSQDKKTVTVTEKRKAYVDTGEKIKPLSEGAVVETVDESKQVSKELIPLEISIPVTAKELAVRLQQKPSVILRNLLQKGIFLNINQNLNEETIEQILADFGFALAKLKTEEEQLVEFHEKEEDISLLQPRSPVVTFMGHVDHGKTSLLDKIRKSKVVDEEHGGITQHIGAYSVRLPKGRIAFLDTPGHEAFTSMRARGAHITDLVVLVVAADEGIMPQTEEAIDHARAAEVPIIIALNKIDKRNADPDRVKKQLSERDLSPEDWGGKAICIGVSALTGEGIDHLLEMILLEAEMLELKANPNKNASGIVIEAHLSGGKGSVASVIVQNGTLHEGDIVIAGSYYGRVKAMLDDHERPIKEAGPATPAEIIGLSGVPEAGEIFYAVDDERQAKEIASRRQERIKNKKLQAVSKITLEDLYAQIQEGKVKALSIILKADVKGSLGALKESLLKIPNDQVQLKFIHTGVGEINTSDVILASASNAIIIGFNVGMDVRAKGEVEKQQVDVRTYRLIYDAVSDIRKALEGLLDPRMKKKVLGRVEIRQVLKLTRGIVAGCYVLKGKVHRKSDIDVVRNGEVVITTKVSSLKRFKDDVREVSEGFECGITIDRFEDIQVGDIIEAYELEKIARTL